MTITASWRWNPKRALENYDKAAEDYTVAIKKDPKNRGHKGLREKWVKGKA